MPAVATAEGLPTRLGKYEILTPLAAGGMARIYIARTTGIGMFERHVVLKLITPERANDVVAVQMFLDEARLAAALNHQNVAQVFEVGEDRGTHYLAMEYVHGQDLRALLAKAGSQGTRVPLELALTVVAGAAAGLNHAHERRGPDGTPLGIVHRDVSPSNIMIGYDGSVKLLDFGIAKAAARSVETQSGIIKGKFAYMAPEQCRGRDVDRRSDVFSLGIILYEVSTQHRCFRADSDFDTMHRIVTGDVVRPTRIVQGYPQALEAIVMKALAVDATTRYQSASALLEAIESFAVSSRMSLSTMSLGRFMRDMFGDQPEPWLVPSGSALPIEPRENTISNTNSAGEVANRAASKGLPSDPVVASAPVADDEESEDDAAATFLMGEDQLGAMAGDVGGDDAGGSPMDWNAPTDYDPALAARHARSQLSATKPAPASAQVPVPAPAPAPAPTVVPSSLSPKPTLIGTGRPSVGSISASRPAVAATPGGASTRHGYASGSVTRGDAAGALAGVTPIDPSERLTPNRRPLFIGLGLAVVGIGVLLAVTLGGDDEPAKPEDAPLLMNSSDTKPEPAAGSGASGTTDTVEQKAAPEPPKLVDPPRQPTIPEPSPAPTTDNASTGTAGATAAVDKPAADPKIELDIMSEPPGAEVLLAGKVIGTTPFRLSVDKGKGPGTLTVRKASFLEATQQIDLRDNVTLKLTLKKAAPATTTPSTNQQPKGKPTGGGTTTKPAKADCQPAGQYNGFDSRPVCK